MRKPYGRLNLLYSYAYVRLNPVLEELICAMSPYVNVLIDSGAHTNHQIRIKKASGKNVKAEPVELSDYITFLKRPIGKSVWQYIALDVIRNKTKTDENLSAMLDAGLRPMPVFIEGHTEKDLEHLVNVNPRICVAGGVGSSDAYIRRRYRQIFDLSHQQAKIHGLGYGRWPGTFKACFISCDSSSFNYGARFGPLSMYDRRRGFLGMPWKELSSSHPPKKPALRPELVSFLANTFTLNAQDLGDVKLFKGHRAIVNIPFVTGILAYLDFMAHVQEFHKDYFMALSKVDATQVIAIVAYAAGTGDMSYKNILDLHRHVRAEQKVSQQRGISAVVELFEKGTQWKPLPHSL